MMTISYSDFMEFERVFFDAPSPYNHQRYGQAFCNHFGVKNTKLFFEIDQPAARRRVFEEYTFVY